MEAIRGWNDLTGDLTIREEGKAAFGETLGNTNATPTPSALLLLYSFATYAFEFKMICLLLPSPH
jgi:hypothetical protein